MNLEAVRPDALRHASSPPATLAAAGPVRAGFRRDRVQHVAAILVWAVTLVVSLVAVWPAWQWWASALELAPRGDVLVDRIDLVVLKELVQFDRASMFGMANAALTGGLVLALLLNPLLGGGVIGLLTATGSGATASRRFFEAGVRFYGRYFRALIYVGVAGVTIGGIIGVLTTLALDAVAERGLERAWAVAQALQYALLALLAAFFTAVLDLARIRLAVSDSRHVLVACLDALRLGLRRLGALAGIGAAFLALLALAAAILLTARAVLPGRGWLALGVAFLLQQALAFLRVRLRVSTMAALATLVRARPGPPPASDEPRFAEYDRQDDALDAAE